MCVCIETLNHNFFLLITHTQYKEAVQYQRARSVVFHFFL